MNTIVAEMSATDLIGRLVHSPGGGTAVITGLSLDCNLGVVWFDLDGIDHEHELLLGEPFSIPSLSGWTVSHRVDWLLK